MFKIGRKFDKRDESAKNCPDCGTELTPNNIVKISIFDNRKDIVCASYCVDCGSKRFITAANMLLTRNKEEN